MNTKSKWASTIFSVSALGAAILLSAPAKANCYPSGAGGGVDTVTATQYSTWTYGNDYCNTEAGNGAADVQYAVAYANNSSFGNTGFAVTYPYSYSNFGGTHQYRDATCVLCANVGWQCDPSYTAWQTASGNTFPPSSSAGCPYGDGASQAEGFVELE
jgi:hypothetical protein